VTFSEKVVLEKLNQLKPGKAPGVDNLQTSFLKEVKDEIAKPLCRIFRESMESGQVPVDWKRANVSPIFKKGKRSSPGNYRPVSLTSNVCKIMESIIRDEIVKHLKENNCIRDSQHGFVKGKSCLTNLLLFLEKLTKIVDDGQPADVLYLDFSKAFDRVPHKRLVLKMKAHGIGPKVCAWIASWLDSRQQRVVVNGQESNWEEVKSGVPQGSVLGPLAFVVYINDLDLDISSVILKFADDSKMLAKVECDADATAVQNDLEKLYEWSQDWQMEFNAEKCKCLHIGAKNSSHEYSIGGNMVAATTQEKDLGVLIDSSLNWGKQCAKVARSGNLTLGQISRTFTYKSKSVVKNLYKSLVRPQLDYCMQAWRPWLQQDVNLLEGVQRGMSRMVPGLRHLPYEARLKSLGLTTLETRRRRADLIEVFRMFKGLEDIDPNQLFVLKKDSKTRGHSLKIEKPRARLDVRKYFFSHRVINDWNKLPSIAIESNTLNEFKGHVDKYLSKYAEDYTSQRTGSLPRQSSST
jgi:hypothetical protein